MITFCIHYCSLAVYLEVRVLEYSMAVPGPRERKTLELLNCAGIIFARDMKRCA